MGGLVGHMNHIYDYDDMQICDLAIMLEDINNNRCNLYEKIDGFNLNIGLSAAGQIIVARNKGDLNLKPGGMTEAELAEKYANKPDVLAVFSEAINILRPYLKVCEVAHFWSEFTAAGLGPRYMLNVECVMDGRTNLIHYPVKRVFIHNLSEIRANGNGEWMFCGSKELPDNMIKLIDPFINICTDHKVRMESTDILFTTELTEFFGSYRTIAGYKWARFVKWINREMPELVDPILVPALYSFIIQGNGTRNHLKELCNKYTYDSLVILLDGRAKECKRYVMDPIIDFFADLEYRMLEHIEDSFNQTYYNTSVEYLYTDLLNVASLNIINSTNSSYIADKLAKLGGKLLPMEGIVLNWRGKTIKLTGTFVYLTRILGDYKYRKDK